MSLYNKALLVSLSIGMPPMSKTLKAQSEKIEFENRTEPNQATVVTKLFARQDTKGLQQAASKARKYFKEKSLPYGRSLGIIPAKNYFNFLQDIGNFRLEFNTEKENIIRNIEEVIANARAANGDLFDRNNYPSIAELEANIYFSIEANPVPATNDYDKLADLTPEEIELLKKEAVLSNQSKLESAMQDLFGRLMKGLIHAAERLKDDDNGEMQIFRDSLIGNIGKAVEAAETLNIEDNDQLQQFTDKIKDVFDGLSAQELRTNSQLRKETAAKAADIAQKMSELF